MKNYMMAVAIGAGLLMPALGQAGYSFSSGGVCSGDCSGTTASSNNTLTYGDLAVSAWSNTGGSYAQDSASGSIQQAYVKAYSGGLGVKNDDAYSSGSDKDKSEGVDPEHAIDNDGRYDMVLFDFGTKLYDLDSISVGWYSKGADLTVLAYTGSTAFSGLSAATSWSSLTSNGWSVIGNYEMNGTGTISVNSANRYSSQWLIGAYNPIFASSATPTVGTPDSGCTRYSNTYMTVSLRGACKDTTTQPNKNDYFKLAGVAGSFYAPPPPPPPSQGVSEPASLALAGVALLGLLGARRRRSE